MKTLKIIWLNGLGVIVLFLVWAWPVALKQHLLGSGSNPQNSHETTTPTQYVNSQAGFKITMPAGWQEITTQAGNLADFKNSQSVIIPGTGSYSPYIDIVSAPAQFPSLGALVSADISGLSLQTFNFRSISSTPETIDGQPASLLSYSFRQEGTPPLTNAQLIVVKNDTEYGITGTSLSSDWALYSGDIQKALLSLQI
ncbi:MAG TPA: hypothetical protein VNG32_03125 [Candidatus Dormibacteraeota bacterium]|nr:hypothetical protein [Candidatus Dormibacteraeota bacterium]